MITQVGFSIDLKGLTLAQAEDGWEGASKDVDLLALRIKQAIIEALPEMADNIEVEVNIACYDTEE